MTTRDKIVGSLLIGYGLLKVFIGGTASFASDETKDEIKAKMPWTKVFYGDDETVSGRALEFSLFLFGAFSLLHGLNKFELLPHTVSEVLDKPSTEVAVYSALGLGLVGFYSAVVYSNYPIPKIDANMSHYKIAILSGLSFLIYPVQNALKDQKKQLGSYGQVWQSSGSSKVEFAAYIGIVVFAFKMLKEGFNLTNANIHNDLLDLSNVILSTLS